MNIDYTTIASIERPKRENGRPFALRLFALALMGVFFVALMACLAVGVQVFGKAADVQQRTDQLHLQSGFLSNIVHAGDAAGAVGAAEGPEGEALVLAEELPSGTYETRLYLYRGQVCQEYAIAGRPFNPDTATPLFESDTFAFSLEGRLLHMTTDQGTVDVALRSEQGGAL